MSAREAILSRLRKAVPQQEGRQDAVRARLGQPAQAAPVPAAARLSGAERVDQFEAKARAADATVSRIAGFDALPAALADELRARNLPAAIRTGTDARLAGLDWGGLDRSEGPGRIEEPATLSVARLGMAETGSLVFGSGPDNPVTLCFLGETHFAAVRSADIKAGFEDVWQAWREAGLDTRTINFVTGPSRSADIGQTLQLGAHGPVALHIFIVEES
jgi:L-lactate utilization protein LutC